LQIRAELRSFRVRFCPKILATVSAQVMRRFFQSADCLGSTVEQMVRESAKSEVQFTATAASP
jgi:DUF971 family protein